MICDSKMLEMFLDDGSRRKLREFFYKKEIPASESLRKIKGLIKEHLDYINKCKEKNTLVTSDSGEQLFKRVKGILSVTYDEDEKYNATLYFFSWYYNTILSIYNMSTASDLQYITEDVIQFSLTFKYLVNENENILTIE